MEAVEEYLNYFTKVREGEYVGTAIQVARNIISKYHFKVSEDYVARYVSIPLKRDYGKTSQPGEKGRKTSVWLKCTTSKEHPVCYPLTEKEKQDLKEIVKEIFSSKEYAEMTEGVKNGEYGFDDVKRIASDKHVELNLRSREYFEGEYYLITRGSRLEDAVFGIRGLNQDDAE